MSRGTSRTSRLTASRPWGLWPTTSSATCASRPGPVPTDDRHRRGLRAVALALEEGAAFVADYGNPYARDDDVERDYEQMLAQFGVRYRPDLLHGGSNLGFSELAEKALSALGHQPLPPDLLIVTYAVPGAPLIKVTAAHLNRLMGNTGNGIG